MVHVCLAISVTTFRVDNAFLSTNTAKHGIIKLIPVLNAMEDMQSKVAFVNWHDFNDLHHLYTVYKLLFIWNNCMNIIINFKS